MLSKKQQATATKAAEVPWDATVAVTREGGSTPTATGKQKAVVTIHTAMPCHFSPHSDPSPTVEKQGDANEVQVLHGYLFVPTEWEDAQNTGTTIPVVIQKDDVLAVDGIAWLASADMDQQSGFLARRRVRVHRSHNRA